MKFSDWFEQQFGKEPYVEKSIPRLISDIHELQYKLAEKETQLKKKHQWIANKTNVMYAWNLKDEDKK